MEKKVIGFFILLSTMISMSIESIQEHVEIQKEILKIEAKQDSIILIIKK